VESPSLEAFKNRVDVALRDMGSGHGGNGLMVGLDDLGSMILTPIWNLKVSFLGGWWWGGRDSEPLLLACSLCIIQGASSSVSSLVAG